MDLEEQTLSHSAVLQAPADEPWEACKHVHRIVCDLLPDYYIKVGISQGHGEPGSIRLVTTGPAIKHAGPLKKRKFDDASKTLGYTVLEGDSRYTFSVEIQFVAKALNVLGGDSRCGAFVAEIQFMAKDATVTEATWTSTFVPKADMGPPEHINAFAEVVFQTLEKAVHMKKTFTHTETLDVSPDALWNACKHVDEILLEQMPQHFESSTMVEGHGGPGTVRVAKFGPERTDFIDPEEKRMGYTVLKGDPRYKYFAATMHFSAGPSTNSTNAVWVATYVPDGDMGPPEHVRDVVTSVWKAVAAAAKANPERYA